MNVMYHHRTQAGGACGQHVREMVRAFERAGHRVTVVAPPGVRDAGPAGTGAQKKNRYRVPQIVFEALEVCYNAVALVRLYRQLKKARYHLLYERYAILNIAGVVAAAAAGIPVLLEVSFTSMTPVYPPRTRLLALLARCADRFIFGRAAGIVTVSTVLKDNLVRYFGVAPEKVLVLPNAVDPGAFDPAASGAAVRARYGLDGYRVVGFVGGFYPWHGLDLLLDAAEYVGARRAGVKYLVVGDGPLREAVAARIRASALLRETVVLTGSVPHRELTSYLAAFDVGVMPDSNDYGSPMKIFEYMAMGKPVVAPRLRPLEEVIDHGTNGLLFAPRDRAALGEAILGILADPAMYRRVADRARAIVLQRHTWAGHARAIMTKWKDTLPAEAAEA
jgi:glycosyltransferase involved in cell wall biosynthesis